MASEKVRLEVVIRNPEAKLPHRKRDTDAGYDVTSLIDVSISPGEVVHIDAGLAVAAPSGYFYTTEGRSSMYRSGVVPFRGIIDAQYSGNVVVSLMNVGKETYNIKKGDRVAQLVLHKLIHAEFDIVEEVSEGYNARAQNGFGSSGR